MKATGENGRGDRQGFALVTTVVILAIAGMTVGWILIAMQSYSRQSENRHFQDTATFLADSGLHAAVVKLNAQGDGAITYTDSKGYFSATNSFLYPDWGFTTRMGVNTSGQNVVYSTGRYAGRSVDVQSAVTLGAGTRSIHALFAHALFAGNSAWSTNYTLRVGGLGTSADFVNGDTYAGGKIALSGNADLRLPEILVDTNHDGICGPGETWTNAFALRTFTNPLSASDYAAYTNSVRAYFDRFYSNGRYDVGEPYVDTIGNGVYDVGEPFVDANTNQVRDPGDSFIDRNGNGVYDAGVDTVVDHGNGQYDTGEEWVEDNVRKYNNKKVRVNGRWDAAGGFWQLSSGTWRWRNYSACSSWPAEEYEDVGDGVYNAVGEAYTDQNGVYDQGERYLDDRNTTYDYGTQASGAISGMPAPGPGQRAATGSDPRIDPPDLTHMYYEVNHSSAQPYDALSRWGNDVAVQAADYGSAVAINDASRPEHIFIRNPPIGTSGSVSSGGKTIYKRSYSTINNSSGQRVDDYFFEDPTDASYNSSVSADSIDGTDQTAPMYVNVRPDHNVMVYYVDGNLYLHHPQVYSMRFRTPGTRVTIVARGNITISDEFYYNADYDPGLTSGDINSTIVNNPKDALCLIALKNPNCPTNSGNILIGDRQFGTGGSIHAMLYAENDFVDNNLNTANQSYISIFGNMSAGNQVRINRTEDGSPNRTRLDVTLDDRIRSGTVIVPGLPHPVGMQRSIFLDTAWHLLPGTWKAWSLLR